MGAKFADLLNDFLKYTIFGPAKIWRLLDKTRLVQEIATLSNSKVEDFRLHQQHICCRDHVLMRNMISLALELVMKSAFLCICSSPEWHVRKQTRLCLFYV